MPTPIYFGGLGRSGVHEAADGLDKISKEYKYTRTDWPFPGEDRVDLDSLSPKELELELVNWLATVWSERNPVPSDEDLERFDMRDLEDEFRRDYAAGSGLDLSRGATAEQMWIACQLASKEPFMWLVNREQPPQPLDRVSRKRFFDAIDLVFLLGAACVEWQLDEPALSVATFDGETGHVIYVAGLNAFEFAHPAGRAARRGWFRFHDPWPARSLLAESRNRAGARAIEDYPRAPLWLISPEDLARVIYGVLLPLSAWNTLGDWPETVELMEADRCSGTGMFPAVPWGCEAKPFDDLIRLAGNTTGSEVGDAMGHGELHLERGEPEQAEGWFEIVLEIRGPEAAGPVAAIFEAKGDLGRAKRWFRQAAEADDAAAARMLGWLLLDENERDPEALRWLERAAEAGDNEAAGIIGSVLVRQGRMADARVWYEQAAEGGDMLSTARLGMLLAEEGEAKDQARARTLLARSVDAGVDEGAPLLAILLVDAGEVDRARAVLEWARTRGNDVDDVMEMLGL